MPEPALALPAVSQQERAPLHALPSEQRPELVADGLRIDISKYDLGRALTLERELGTSHVLSQILVRRGFAHPDLARGFLDPREVHDPGLFDGIDGAIALIRRHIDAGNLITVHGDYDVDGVSATAIMVRALRSLGAEVNWFLPRRAEEGYGLSGSTVERLESSGTRLLVTVDCGITSVAEVEAAKALGVDVVVTDHHLPRADGALPDCRIVHPSVCGYPSQHACGAAVAFKLAQALGAQTATEDVELVALATVADLVPLTGENRTLVRDGIKALAGTAKPGVRALLRVARADPSAVSSATLGFRLAPRINAAGRLRAADAGLELLLTTDQVRAEEIAGELDALNAERRVIEQRILWEAEALLSELGQRSAYVLAGDGWHPGVIGIVASRIVERLHRPTILVAVDGELGTGSGRSIPGFDLLAALHQSADKLERYGGHRAAAGLTVRRDQIVTFRQAFERAAEEALTAELMRGVERVDAIVSGAELGLQLADELEALEPCGIGNPPPRLLVTGARFRDLRPMGEGRHARFSVSSGGARSSAVAFGWGGRLDVGDGQPLDATFSLERNAWNGAVEPRLILRHWQPSTPGEIQVLGEHPDYVAAVLAELDVAPGGPREREGPTSLEFTVPPGGELTRTVLDRRTENPIAVLADAVAGGGPVLALCADVPRRLTGLQARTGGFALGSYHALERDPSIAVAFPQLVALDPPTGPEAARLLGAGRGHTHLAWGHAELRFAQQIHELEYGLRASLVALYRSLRPRHRAVGEELELLLRGDGPHPRPARLAGRLIRVLAELELVSLDRDLPALTIAGGAQTALERSQAYRAYAQRHEDGRRFLSSANLLPDG